MAGKLLFIGGVAVGYVLGTRAGREKFDQLAGTVRKVADDPTVKDAIGVVQSQARRVYADSRAVVADRLHLAQTKERRADAHANGAEALVESF